MSDTVDKKEYKQYFDKNRFNFIKSKIPNDTYGEFTPLVYEILMRRWYTFDLTEEDISNDINNLLEYCKTIQFSENFENNSSMGHVKLDEKLLEINSNYYKNNPDFTEMFEVLTHELYHVFSAKKADTIERVYTGLQYFDDQDKIVGTPLNEVFNEYAADVACYGRKEEKEPHHYPTNGYGTTTFVVPLLAAALGVTEKELLRVGLSSKIDLMDFMMTKIPEKEHENFMNSFDQFEFQLGILFNLSNAKEMTEDDKKQCENALIEIEKFAHNTLYASIMNDNRELTKEVQEEYEYRRDAVRNISDDATNIVRPFIIPGGRLSCFSRSK